MDTREAFFKHINRQMYIKGLSRAELAAQCGVSRVYMSNILNLKEKPSVKISSAIAQALGIDEEKFRQAIYDAMAS